MPGRLHLLSHWFTTWRLLPWDFILPNFIPLDFVPTEIILWALFSLDLISLEIVLLYVVPLNFVSLDLSNWRIFAPLLEPLWLEPLHLSPVPLIKLRWTSVVGVAQVGVAETSCDSRLSALRDVLRLAGQFRKQRVVDGAEKNGRVETLPDVGDLSGRLLPRVPVIVEMNPLPLKIQLFTNSSLPETSLALLTVVGLFGITRVKVGAFRVADGPPKQ